MSRVLNEERDLCIIVYLTYLNKVGLHTQRPAFYFSAK